MQKPFVPQPRIPSVSQGMLKQIDPFSKLARQMQRSLDVSSAISPLRAFADEFQRLQHQLTLPTRSLELFASKLNQTSSWTPELPATLKRFNEQIAPLSSSMLKVAEAYQPIVGAVAEVARAHSLQFPELSSLPGSPTSSLPDSESPMTSLSRDYYQELANATTEEEIEVIIERFAKAITFKLDTLLPTGANLQWIYGLVIPFVLFVMSTLYSHHQSILTQDQIENIETQIANVYQTVEDHAAATLLSHESHIQSYIVARTVYLREKPHFHKGKILVKLHPGQITTLEGRRGTWIRVSAIGQETGRQVEGWIPKKYSRALR